MIGPSKTVRRQAQLPPSTVITISKEHDSIWKDKGFRRLLLPIVVIYLTQICTGFDATMTGNLQSFSQWKVELGNPNSSQLGAVTSIYFVGALVGSIPAAIVTDKLGRKLGIFIGQIFTIAGAGFQAGSHGLGQYMGSRLILGFGIAFITTASPALLSELATPRIRGTLVSFFNPFWYLGSIMASWICFGTAHMAKDNTWNWRIPSLLQAIIPCIVLPMVYFVPESPRWLVAKGRLDEAKAIITKYHANGDENDPIVSVQLSEIKFATERAAEDITWKALFTQKTNIHRLLIVVCMTLMALWCGQNIITFYFTIILSGIGITDTAAQTGISGGLNIANFISSLIGAAIVDRVGRRPLWMISFVGMIVIFVPFIALTAVYQRDKITSEGYGVIVCLFLFDIMYNVACNPLLYSYTTEIMPFYMRSKGLAVKNLVGQVALVINQYVNPIALTAITYNYYIFFLGLNCIWLFLIWMFFPETGGYSLEELQAIFEDDHVLYVDGIIEDKGGVIEDKKDANTNEVIAEEPKV